MLTLTISGREFFNEETNEFVYTKEQTIVLEHSLVSLSKWESKWCKPFLSDTPKTFEETVDYIKCMTITQNVDPNVYLAITDEQIEMINKYIKAPMTATWFNEKAEQGGKLYGKQITNELIYYWMVALNIPFKCEKWHFQRLMTLIKVCNAEQQPPKKMDQKTRINQYAAINAARRAKLNSKG